MEFEKYKIPTNALIEEGIKKYGSLQELIYVYTHNQTQLNYNEYFMLAAFFYARENIIIPKEIGSNLESMISDSEYVYGVHRTGLAPDVDKILREGLELTNHGSSGIANSDSGFSLEHNITFHSDYCEFLKALSEGAVYKRYGLGWGSALIVKIPKAKFKDQFSLINNEGSKKVLKPEYLCGYVTSRVTPEGKFELEELVTPGRRILVTKEAVMRRYSQLADIINSDVYKNYWNAIQNGEAVVWRPEFDGVEEEMAALEEKLRIMEEQEREHSGPQI